MKIKLAYFVICFLCFQFLQSQTVKITGVVIGNNDMENIHIINKTLQKFAITDSNGSFKILAKLNDTLVVSSIQNKLKAVIIDQDVILSKSISIRLEEFVNTLDEVVLGKVLSGDLLQDMNNIVGEPITAKKLGIPSYQGKPKTQSERLLQEASDFNPTIGGFLGGAGASVGIIPIINAISGRTKKLKKRVKLEAQEELMYSVKARLSQDFFRENSLDENLIMDFFYFCADDVNFKKRCQSKSDLEILEYLNEKLQHYKANLELKR